MVKYRNPTSKNDSCHGIAVSTRGRIVGMHEAGLNVTDIAVHVQCSRVTVHHWLRVYTQRGEAELRNHRRNNRGPRKTTPQQDADIIEHFTNENPFNDSISYVVNVHPGVSAPTVRRRLKQAKLVSGPPAKKSALSPENRAQRMLACSGLAS